MRRPPHWSELRSVIAKGASSVTAGRWRGARRTAQPDVLIGTERPVTVLTRDGSIIVGSSSDGTEPVA